MYPPYWVSSKEGTFHGCGSSFCMEKRVLRLSFIVLNWKSRYNEKNNAKRGEPMTSIFDLAIFLGGDGVIFQVFFGMAWTG